MWAVAEVDARQPMRVELDVPDVELAARLLGDLVGGIAEPGSAPDGADGRDGGARRQPAGALVAWRAGAASGRARLRRVAIGMTDPEAVAGRVRAAGLAVAPDGGDLVVRAEVLGIELALTPLDLAAPPTRSPFPDGRGTAGATAFDHLCLAVPSLALAVHLLRDLVGGEVVFGGRNAALGTLSSQVALGPGTRIELLQPARPDAPIARFLDRRGPGLHHLTWHVADVAAAVRGAESLGFAVVDTDLTSRAHWRETYLRPASAMGLLVQLSWTDLHHDEPLDDAGVAAILAGRVASHDNSMHPA